MSQEVKAVEPSAIFDWAGGLGTQDERQRLVILGGGTRGLFAGDGRSAGFSAVCDRR